MHKKFIGIAAFTGALAVILGAFGTHALKAILSPGQLVSFETGVRYQFYHAFALLAAGILYKEFPNNLLQWAGRLFICGILLFSGSLYVLTTMPGMTWVGPITPLGGLCFIAGWLLLALGCLKK